MNISRRETSAKVRGIERTMIREFNIPRFELSDEEANMVSLPQRCVTRNESIARLLTGLGHAAVVIDCYACVGGDTLSFAKMAEEYGLRLEIMAVQCSSSDDMGRVERLREHVRLYFRHNSTAGDYAKVLVFNTPVQKFIMESLEKPIDLLYLDPVWHLPEGFDLSTNHGTDVDPSPATVSFITSIQNDVFGPMLEKGCPRPGLICLKAPTPFVEFSLALFNVSPFVRGYTLRESIPFRDRHGVVRFFYHILCK